MRLLGYDIKVSRAPVQKTAVSPITQYQPGWNLIYEAGAGFWQRNIITRNPKNVLTHSAVYGCVTLIVSDVGKLAADGICLEQRNSNGIWVEVDNPAYSKFLRKPNRYQNRIKFVESWVQSKLLRGNSYILKQRDDRGVVEAAYVMDPDRSRVLVAPDGSIFYQFGSDNLAGITGTGITVPASEVMHDIYAHLYHPLCGVSPITACALPACHGLQIQEHSAKFFANSANPGGILTAPGNIPQETADRLKREWESRAAADNVGRLIVGGDGLKFEKFGINSVDSQLIEQLKWTAEQVCTSFHVPPFMIGVGPLPSYNNVQALTQMYYAQCLQSLIELFELTLGEGLSLANDLRIKLDLDALLQMDTVTKVTAATNGIGGGLFAPNEQRKKFNLKPLEGGDTVYLQQQEFSLEALAKRDARDDPFATSQPAPANDEPEDEGGEDLGDEPDDERRITVDLEKGYDEYSRAA